MNRKDLPQDEYDIRKLDSLAKLSDDDFRDAVPELFRWTEDREYAIYPFVIDLLAYRQVSVVDEIRKVFRTDNVAWQKNLLDDLIVRLSNGNKEKLRRLMEKACSGSLKEEARLCYEYCFESRPLIRTACRYDCPVLAETKLKVWNETFIDIYPRERFINYSMAEQTEYFLNIVNDPNQSLYVLEINGQCAGYMCCGAPFTPYLHYEQCINLLNLLKIAQGKGLGRKMFELAESIISFRGYAEFFLMCNKYNYPAQRFYEHMGGIKMLVDEDEENRSKPQIRYHFSINKEENQ